MKKIINILLCSAIGMNASQAHADFGSWLSNLFSIQPTMIELTLPAPDDLDGNGKEVENIKPITYQTMRLITIGDNKNLTATDFKIKDIAPITTNTERNQSKVRDIAPITTNTASKPETQLDIANKNTIQAIQMSHYILNKQYAIAKKNYFENYIKDRSTYENDDFLDSEIEELAKDKANNFIKEKYNIDMRDNLKTNTHINEMQQIIKMIDDNEEDLDLSKDLLLKLIDIAKTSIKEHYILAEVDKYSGIYFSFYDLYSRVLQKSYTKGSGSYKIKQLKFNLNEYYKITDLAIKERTRLYLEKLLMADNAMKVVHNIVKIVNTTDFSEEQKEEIIFELENLYKTANTNMIKADRKYMKEVNQVSSIIYKSNQIYPYAYDDIPESIFKSGRVLAEKILLDRYISDGITPKQALREVAFCNMAHMATFDQNPKGYSIYRPALTMRDLLKNKKKKKECEKNFNKYFSERVKHMEKLNKFTQIEEEALANLSNSSELAIKEYNRRFRLKSPIGKIFTSIKNAVTPFMTIGLTYPRENAIKAIESSLNQKFLQEMDDNYREGSLLALKYGDDIKTEDKVIVTSFKSFFISKIRDSLISNHEIRDTAVENAINAAYALSYINDNSFNINDITEVADVKEDYLINKPIDHILEKREIRKLLSTCRINDIKIISSEIEDYDFANKIEEQSKELSVAEQHNLLVNHLDVFNKLRAEVITNTTKTQDSDIKHIRSLDCENLGIPTYRENPNIYNKNTKIKDAMNSRLCYLSSLKFSEYKEKFNDLIKYGLELSETSYQGLKSDPESNQQSLKARIRQSENQAINIKQLLKIATFANFTFIDISKINMNNLKARYIKANTITPREKFVITKYKQDITDQMEEKNMKESDITRVISRLYSNKEEE